MGMPRVWLLLSCAFLAGCYPLRETEAFYTATTDRIYPPLAKDAPVPIISEPPSWPHQVIGRFTMQSDRGYKFIQRALVHNARQQGADAVILRRLAFDQRQTFNYIPPRTDTVPVSNVYNQVVKNNKGQWVNVPQVYTTYVPVFRPGRTMVTEAQWTDVAAEMVVRKGRAQVESVVTPPR